MRRTRLQKAAAMVNACHSAIFMTSENTYPPLARQREEDLERAWAEYRAAEAEEAEKGKLDLL